MRSVTVFLIFALIFATPLIGGHIAGAMGLEPQLGSGVLFLIAVISAIFAIAKIQDRTEAKNDSGIN